MLKLLCYLFGHRWKPYSAVTLYGEATLVYEGRWCRRCWWFEGRLTALSETERGRLTGRARLEQIEAGLLDRGGSFRRLAVNREGR